MFIAITLSLLLVTAISLIVLRIYRPDFNYAWPLALIGSLLAWISTFLWQIGMPHRLVIFSYAFKDVYNYSINLVADGTNFPYALGLTSLAVAVILVSAMQARNINPMGWVNIFILSVLGLLAVLADNPLTLVIAWSLIDIAGLLSALRAVDEPHLSGRAVLSYSARVMGTGILLWAGVLGSSRGGAFEFSSIPPGAGLLILLGVLLRLGSMLIHLPYSKDPSLRGEYDTSFYLVSAAASLIVLTHLTMGASRPLASTFMTVIIAVIGLLTTFNWLRSSEELTRQPYWITGVASLAIAAALQGNPIGSAAWGSACLFAGGLLFLFSARKRWLTIILLVAAFSLSALPFSLTATGWVGNPSSWLPLLLLLPLQGLLISSYVRSVARQGGDNLDDKPIWVRIFYPLGLILLMATGLLLGIAGWAGAGQIGAWIPGAIASLIALILSILLVRMPLPTSGDSRFLQRPTALVDSTAAVFWGLFRSIRGLLELLSTIFEGDGGFLWTILLLVVFISLLGGLIR